MASGYDKPALTAVRSRAHPYPAKWRAKHEHTPIPPLGEEEIERRIAADLRDAEQTASPIEPFADRLGETNVAAAYRVQHLNTEIARSRGRQLGGRKIGLTAEAVQQQLGVDQSDYGALFTDMRIRDGEPSTPRS